MDLDYFHKIYEGDRTRAVKKEEVNGQLLDATKDGEAKTEELPMIPTLVPSDANAAKPSPLKALTPLQQAPPIHQQQRQPLEGDEDDGELEPRNLMVSMKPVPKSVPSQAASPTESQPSRVETVSAPIDYEKPPPLFVVEDELLQSKDAPEPSTGKQPSRSPMPDNMMNSLATGKF